MAESKWYSVYYPNYIGITGRGTCYAFSSQSDMAVKEFDDIVDGTDHLIGMGIADQNRIGVTGGSYGGYASAWMSTYYTDRFAAAVMFVGIKIGRASCRERGDVLVGRASVKKKRWRDWNGR